MSRDLEQSNYYITHGGIIPVKWTAPEVSHCSIGIHSSNYYTPFCCRHWISASTQQPVMYGALVVSCTRYGVWDTNHLKDLQIFRYANLWYRLSNYIFTELCLFWFFIVFFPAWQCMQLVGSGFRLAPPPGCPRPLYELMIRCWWVALVLTLSLVLRSKVFTLNCCNSYLLLCLPVL